MQGKPQARGVRATFDIKELRRARQAYRRKHDAAAVEPERKRQIANGLETTQRGI